MSTIRDVSNQSGVSIATISRYLRNDSSLKIKEETKEKIDSAIKELNYVHKSKKAVGQKMRIGVVLAYTSQKYSDPFFSTILTGIEDECEKFNASVISVCQCIDLEKPELLTQFCSQNLDGIIIMENINKSTLSVLEKHTKNIVFVDQYNPSYNNVGIDHFSACKKVMNCFIENGYKRIAYVGGAVQNVNFDDSYRTIAYRESLRRAHIEYDESIYINCDWNIDLCAKLTKELLLTKNRPDAIFAGSDTIASVILGVLHELNLKCPDDIGLIGFNGLAISSHYAPALTTLSVPMYEIGRIAFQRLHQLITKDEDTTISINLPTEITIRNSIKLKGE
ncbi:MAG: LacI family DNA-binding transcriptional regulator [Anaerorhabdus sp.]|uniref:LacI family DNA-binding transcriptional regulator n=1 Tax=Anaerorhabdus sp. TaxID=1872524 RepID=UPI003A86B596